MKSLSKWVLIALWCSSQIALAELTGQLREEFMANAVESCFSTQVRNPINRDVPRSVVMDYCECTSEYFADYYTEQTLKDIADGYAKFNSYIPELAARYCANELSDGI